MNLPSNSPILSSHAMRKAEMDCAAHGTPLALLMERAGRAISDLGWRMAAGRPILILCGTGNNGGDGYVAARLLLEQGADVVVAALGPPKTPLAQAAFAQWKGRTVSLMEGVEVRPIVIDALFGLGISRPLSSALVAALAPLASARILAVDLPSGIDADGLHPWPAALPADITLALGALKPAHVLLPMAGTCGQIRIAPLDEEWRSKAHAVNASRYAMRAPTADAHKFTRGMVLVASGAMQGAADLAAMAAMRAGAGYVVMRRHGPAPMAAIITEDAASFRHRLADQRAGALLIGPGSSSGPQLDEDVTSALERRLPLVLDAAAMDAALPSLTHDGAQAPVMLTPHEGEFQRLFPALRDNKLERALAAAKLTGATILYKGADMIIAAPDGRACAFWPGSPWLASAGTGDVLAGACAAMLAKLGHEPEIPDAFAAAIAAARWHIAKASPIGAGLAADDLVRKFYE